MADWFGTETKTHDARNASDDRDDAFFSKRGYTHKEERDVGWQGSFGLKERKHRPDNWAHNQDMGRDHQQVHDDTHGHRDHLSRTLNPDRMPSQARETQTRTNQGTLGSHGLHEEPLRRTRAHHFQKGLISRGTSRDKGSGTSKVLRTDGTSISTTCMSKPLAKSRAISSRCTT